MLGGILFIGAVAVGIFLLYQKIETEKSEDFEERDN